MKITIITSGLIFDNTLILGRSAVTVPDNTLIEPLPSLRLSLDTNQAPVYSEHPEGGWISPSYDIITELHSIGIDPEVVYHVRCKCHKSEHDDADKKALRDQGHTAKCSRFRAPIPISPPSLPPPPPQPTANNGFPSYVNPQVAALLENAPIVAKTPSGGLTDNQLSDLMASLEGTEGNMIEGAQEVGISNFDVSVVAGQLWKNYNFSKCIKCKTWSIVDESRSCRAC